MDVRCSLCWVCVIFESACGTRSAKGPSAPGGRWRVFRPITYALSSNTPANQQTVAAILLVKVVLHAPVAPYVPLVFTVSYVPMPHGPFISLSTNAKTSVPLPLTFLVPFSFASVWVTFTFPLWKTSAPLTLFVLLPVLLCPSATNSLCVLFNTLVSVHAVSQTFCVALLPLWSFLLITC